MLFIYSPINSFNWTARTVITLQRSAQGCRNSLGFQGGMPGWNDEANLQKPKLMLLSQKKANPPQRPPRWLSEHCDVRGNVATVQCLEVFSLCISPRKLLQYVFYRKPMGFRAASSKAGVKQQSGNCLRFGVRGPFLYFCHVPKYPVVGPKETKQHTCLWSWKFFAEQPQGLNMWLLKHFLKTKWIWDWVGWTLKPWLAQRPTLPKHHHTPLFVFCLWHSTRSSGLLVWSLGQRLLVNPSLEGCLWWDDTLTTYHVYLYF